jgi:hypothetical protein
VAGAVLGVRGGAATEFNQRAVALTLEYGALHHDGHDDHEGMPGGFRRDLCGLRDRRVST